ncbi:MAG: polysaccharide deacetylase family protein [Pseudomonadota bacterium]
MKAQVLELLRRSHVAVARDTLPTRIALYFHALEAVDRPAFSAAMKTFATLGYRFVDARTYAFNATDEKLVFVSFDDNYRSWHDSLDTLEACGVTATFYVNSGVLRDTCPPDDIAGYFDRIRHTGERVTLNRAEIYDLAERGHTIGCHTHSHPVLSALPPENWPDEILRSKQTLEDLSGRAVQDFSFPFGMRRHFSSALRTYCASIGFRTIATGLPAQHRAGFIDPLALHRTEWKFDLSLADNLTNLRIDGRLYGWLFGRSVIG